MPRSEASVDRADLEIDGLVPVAQRCGQLQGHYLATVNCAASSEFDDAPHCTLQNAVKDNLIAWYNVPTEPAAIKPCEECQRSTFRFG